SISLFHGLGVPLLVGTSRKSFMRKLAGTEDPKDRIFASVAAAIDAVSQGAQIVRVHDVKETRQALSVWLAIRDSQRAGPG
ncbi:MAG TPA: dihydropteroate synthase, partial [Hyphomicrobiales bacterium]|nr:dihydropteroate synthase [Hyphomicrobiales bacterium]